MFRNFLLLTFALLLVVTPARAQDGYRPWLQKRLLSRCSEIGVGRLVESQRLSSGELLLRFEIVERLAGNSPKKILVAGSGPEILAYRELEKLLFLEKSEGGYLRVLVDFVDLPKKGGRPRVEFLKRYLAEIDSDGSVAIERRMKRLAFEHLPSEHLWVRRIVLRELREIAARRPALLDGADLLVIEGIDGGTLPRAEQAVLRETLHLLEEANAVAWTRSRLVFPDEETRASFLADLARFERGREPGPRIEFLNDATRVFGRKLAPLIARFLNDPMPEVARRCIALLGEMESAAGLKKLERHALRAEDLETRRAAITAIGKIAPVRSVPLLVRCLETVELQREILVALVSINSAEAALAVKDFDERLRKKPGADPELRRFVTRIRHEDFQKELEEARRRRRARWSRSGRKPSD